MHLNWIRCEGDHWCNLLTLNLKHPHFDALEGVYIIWHGAPDPRVVYIGQGVIKERLEEHRNDPSFGGFIDRGLFATWASVAVSSRNGVERYLADKWMPILGERRPDANPIEVNSPWE